MRVRRCDALPFVSLFLELSRKCYVLSTISYVKEHRNVTPILTLLSLSISPSLHENGLSERILKYQTTLEFNDAPVTGREIAKRENQRHTVERVGKHEGKTVKQEEKKLRKGGNKNNEKVEKERERGRESERGKRIKPSGTETTWKSRIVLLFAATQTPFILVACCACRRGAKWKNND